MTYSIVLHESEEGFAASCPGLPGCWSQGDTESEAIENIREAIQDYLAARSELLLEEGKRPATLIREVEIAV